MKRYLISLLCLMVLSMVLVGVQLSVAMPTADLICDDGDTCFSYNGTWIPPQNSNQYCKYSEDFRFGYSCYYEADCLPSNDHYSVFWKPHQVTGFTPGNYQVFAYISRCNSMDPHTQSAKYYLRQVGDSAATAPLIATINQRHPYQDNNDCSDNARWAALGTQYFNATTYVELRAWTDESVYGQKTTVLFADALKFVYVPPNDTTKPDGNITAPTNLSIIGSDVVNFTADAWDNSGGGGVDRVEFWIRYEGEWHWIGIDSTAPYNIQWDPPAGLKSQILRFAIRVYDKAGNETIDPGGYRYVLYVRSHNNPKVDENWIPEEQRAYLNQLSLVGGGDKCGASSVAMVLAMNGKIARTYVAMSEKADAVYVWRNPIWEIKAALDNNGLQASHSCVSANAGWDTIKEEINANRPAIILSNKFTAGHYFVVVGYDEEGENRQIVVYDPVGKWNGGWRDYDYNTTSSDSEKGKWVAYDYDAAWGYSSTYCTGGKGYLIVASSQQLTLANANELNTEPTTPPDEISDEPENLGIYEGIDVLTEFLTYLPVTLRNSH